MKALKITLPKLDVINHSSTCLTSLPKWYYSRNNLEEPQNTLKMGFLNPYESKRYYLNLFH